MRRKCWIGCGFQQQRGVMAIPQREMTKQGFEKQVGNLPFWLISLLTGLLMPSLEASGNARVVTVSSLGHRRALLDLDWVDDPQLELKKYDPWRAYGIAKLSNIFFAKELNARYGKSGIQEFRPFGPSRKNQDKSTGAY